MRKIFLDIGGFDGVSAEFFRNTHPQGKEFEIHTFECDKRNILTIEMINYNKKLDIKLIKKAAWNENGIVRYYYGNTDGGTMFPSKTTGNIKPEDYYEVECVDIAEYIEQNFSKDDYIILKMNCEGAEYVIIPHLKERGLIDWIDKWYVQWHMNHIKLDKRKHDLIVAMIPGWKPWKAQFRDPNFKKEFLASL